jgi:hypothetical protein
MRITPDFQKENDDMQERQYALRNSSWQRRADAGRFAKINELKGDAKTVISVGCGPKEPMAIGATHACDISALAEPYLRAAGWTGQFFACSCDETPYENKQFDFGVCSEVIEHLPCVVGIMNCIHELDRIAKRWVVTTPWISREQGNTEPTHKHFLDEDCLRVMCPEWKLIVEKAGIFFFIRRDYSE